MGKSLKIFLIALLIGVSSSFILAYLVTGIWNGIVVDKFHVEEITFFDAWLIYLVISIFPISVIILNNSNGSNK